MDELMFLPGVPVPHVMDRLRSAGGKEVESGKFSSSESSAALAVNTFAWFTTRPHLLPALHGASDNTAANFVDVEYCARFPWAGGRHPWLDAVVQTETSLIGVESKRFEPFRDAKSVSLSSAYDRPVWGERMGPFENARDQLRSGTLRFEFLDAAQLIKHGFGLVTQGRRKGLRPRLHYLFAEPASLKNKPIAEAAFAQHREEIARFADSVAGSEVAFSACTYREWISSWTDAPEEVRLHGQRVLNTFTP